jgi:hypothetical protein
MENTKVSVTNEDARASSAASWTTKRINSSASCECILSLSFSAILKKLEQEKNVFCSLVAEALLGDARADF